MIDELVHAILTGNVFERKAAKAAARATYDNTEGKRRWKAAKAKAAEIVASDGYDTDALYAMQHGQAVKGLRARLADAADAIDGWEGARHQLEELSAGIACDPLYEDTPHGRLLAAHLDAARDAIRAAQAIHGWITTSTMLRAVAGELAECPPGEDPCRHGQPYPCQVTRAYWIAKGKDVAVTARQRLEDHRLRRVWITDPPPGGYVCSVPTGDDICGMPVESEPCPEHRPLASWDDEDDDYSIPAATAALSAELAALMPPTTPSGRDDR